MEIVMNIEQKRDLVRNALVNNNSGHVADRWGHVHYTSTETGRDYRYKFMKNVIRLEAPVRYDGSKGWIRLKSYNVSKVYAAMVKKGKIYE